MKYSTRPILQNDIGGFHPDAAKQKWAMGSVWEQEGWYLYTLVKTYKPKVVVAIGIWRGCSTTHIAQALKENGSGHVWAVDINAAAGDLIPAALREYVTFVPRDVFLPLDGMIPAKIDMLFEDGEHSVGFTLGVLKKLQAPVTIVHDYLHFDVGRRVRPEADGYFGREADEVFFEGGTDCGVAVWFGPPSSQSPTPQSPSTP